MFSTAVCDLSMVLLNQSDSLTYAVSGDDNNVFVNGTSVSFYCSIGTLSGPNVTMCMDDGVWRPNPAEVRCNEDTSGKRTHCINKICHVMVLFQADVISP